MSGAALASYNAFIGTDISFGIVFHPFGSAIAFFLCMKVYAVGAYGYGNFGDDYYVDVLRTRMPDLDWTLSGDPEEYRPFHYDFTAMAGGGLLYDKIGPCGTSSLRHHFRYPAAAQWFDKKTGMLATGVQGALSEAAIAPYVPVMQKMDVCTVRDRSSAEFLRGVGVGSVLECADLVYVCGGRPSAGHIERRPVLGVVASQPGAGLAHGRYEGFERRIGDALRSLENDFDLHFFSFDERADPWLSKSWPRPCPYSRFERGGKDSLGRFVRDLQDVDILLTTRYHGAVLATLNRIPFVAIGAPGEKTHRECASIEYPGFASYEAVAEEIAEAVRSAWSERRELERLLKTASARKRSLANRNFQLLQTVQIAGESLASRSAEKTAREVNGGPGRALVVWKADAALWPEAFGLFDRLKSFDGLLPAGSRLEHPKMNSKITLPPPGLMNWNALNADIQRWLQAGYDAVIVCHENHRRRAPRNLVEIAAYAGRRAWDFSLWHHSLSAFQDARLADFRSGDPDRRPARSPEGPVPITCQVEESCP